MYRMTHPSGNPNRTGLTDKIANAPRLTCDVPRMPFVMRDDSCEPDALSGLASGLRER